MLPDLNLKEGWTTVLLLLLLLLCVGWSIQAEQWTPGLQILQTMVLAGGILGIVVAKSRTPSRMAHLLAILAGFTLAAWLTSRVLAGTLYVTEPVAVEQLEWRLWVWANAVVNRQSASSGLPFLLLLAILMWFVAYVSAWAIFRWQRVWWAVILCGIPMMVNVTAAPSSSALFLVAFLLLALLLVVRTSLADYEQEWRREQVQYSSEVVGIFLRAGLVVSVVAISLAWIVPEAVAGDGLQKAWQKASEPWRRLQDAWTESFGDLNYRNPPLVIARSRGMRFSGPVNLTDRPVMDIQAAGGRYWRQRVFHAYTGSGWLNTDLDTAFVEANDPRFVPESLYELQEVLTQTVTLRTNLGTDGTLTAAGQPVQVSLPVEVTLSRLLEDRPFPAEEPAPGPTPDLERLTEPATPVALGPAPPLTVVLDGPSLLYPQAALLAGQTYTVVSTISTAGAQALASVGDDYPQWVSKRYLALPDSVPERVWLQAEEIAGQLDTPFAKVIAIEAYLRGFPYNNQVPGPKPGQDGVDYFLFDEKQGYCSYYASAMVVMLRAVGVPARYVEGYLHSGRDLGVYALVDKDAHAWPEVFFPGYGWVGFEPTASQALDERLHPRPPATDDQDFEAETRRDWARLGFRPDDGPELPPPVERPAVPFWRRVPAWVWRGLGIAAACLGVTLLLVLRHRRRVAGLTAAERTFEDLETWVRRLLGIRPLAHQTPHEYAGAVGKAVPRGRMVIERLADLFVAERFGERAVSREEVRAAWRRAWAALWRRGIERIVERLPRLGRRKLPPSERLARQLRGESPR